MCPLIELKTVSTVYEGAKVPSIKNITLRIQPGEFITIVGPNGAGKTTLLETINGLLPSEGVITVGDMNLKTDGTRIRKRIGYVPQEFICDSLTPFIVEDVVMMGRYGKIGLFKSPTRKDRYIVQEAMLFLSVDVLRRTPVGKLSGGQLQKVMIARALASEPEMLLLDEPFSNLDMKSRSELAEKLTTLNENGLTILMVIHDRSSIPPACRRIITMEQGKIVSDKHFKVMP
ncbi:MAG: metal ABC transporter ATP-binding protein [Theionarchaea archaeon]|nr:metal ABC transporter ATP-binding protein [Theionarchaea archaeon]MBU7000232.1 metal ABC transporter ATP-binding protein [Theionarchaea archaeon]MBU7022123.1 metal ABC transporter ATP-binding protein [Theionarchaea archaeon]MBU7036143.1 metal ABC transporter ATP-binding protein [Theionarchaea archaeon]MBU7041525.1 metal ABC transporter ATP-binding protein [Theionarchaea archaeon]